MSSIQKSAVEEIRRLYWVNQLSARETGDILGRSTSSIYKLMKRHNVARRSAHEANQLTFIKKPVSYNLKINLSEKEKKLKLAAIMLYWAEGSNRASLYKEKQRGATVDFTNSNPEMIKLFTKFLRDICGVEEK